MDAIFQWVKDENKMFFYIMFFLSVNASFRKYSFAIMLMSSIKKCIKHSDLRQKNYRTFSKSNSALTSSEKKLIPVLN